MGLAKITLIGFYNYLDAVSVDLFDAFKDLPAGIDKDTLKGTILLHGGEFQVTYADPYFMKNAIEVWVSKWNKTFAKWVKALSIDYDPLYNYDRTEKWEDTHTGTVKNEGKDTDRRSVTVNGTTETEGEHHGSNEDNTTTKVSAYDSADFSNRDSVDGKGKDDSNDKTTTKIIDNVTQNGGDLSRDNTRTDDLSDKHEGRIYGNIGTLTTQEMLRSELDIASWNLYEHISDLFIEEFCIMVY